MSAFNDLLNWGPISRVRRNHALEHATLQVLGQMNPGLRLAGYSDLQGFWVLGNVDTEVLQEGTLLALRRMNEGETTLAIHPHCGTNFVATGFIAGTLAWLAMLIAGKNWRQRLEKWPTVVLLVTLASIFSQPLGPYLQQKVTTAPPAGLEIIGIMRMVGQASTHRVLTRG